MGAKRWLGLLADSTGISHWMPEIRRRNEGAQAQAVRVGGEGGQGAEPGAVAEAPQ